VTTAADPRIYPAARKGRGAGADLEDLGPINAPRMRVFPFFWTSTASNRRSWSTPILQGPAIIKDVQFWFTFGASPPSMTVEIGTSTVPVLEAGVALTTARPYRVLTELQDPYGGILAAAGDGIPVGTTPTSSARPLMPLDLIVLDPSFYLVVAGVAGGAGVFEIHGNIRVLERINPEALALFL
jgi:hypothetical protein